MKLKKSFCLFLFCLLAFSACGTNGKQKDFARTDIADGAYTADIRLEGGSGRASLQSPAGITVQEGVLTAELIWSSANYDYMVVGGQKYLPVAWEPGSTFSIPIQLDEPMVITADTVAMSTPHEIEYTLTVDSSTLKPVL